MKKRDFDHAISELQRHLPLQGPNCGLPDATWDVVSHHVGIELDDRMQPEDIGLLVVLGVVGSQRYAATVSAHAVLEYPALQAWRAARNVGWMALQHRIEQDAATSEQGGEGA